MWSSHFSLLNEIYAIGRQGLQLFNSVMGKLQVAVVGASGYTGEELITLLARHPQVDLACLTSRQHVGKSVGEVIGRLRGIVDGVFTEPLVENIAGSGAQLAVLALPHGLAYEFAKPLLDAGLKVIDLSADFRLRDAGLYSAYYGVAHPAPELLAEAVYGMPEVYSAEIKQARLIASPGCYPTSVILPLVPLLREKLVSRDGMVVNSASGTSGAGRKLAEQFLFAECNESMKAYGLPRHRHAPEIEQELSVAAGDTVTITFIPHLLPVTRGIHTTIIAPLAGAFSAVATAYDKHFGSQTFVRLLGAGCYPELRNVVRSNFIEIGWHHDAQNNRLIILSAEDNLTKGAGGQAIQSMNCLCGWDESTGLI